MLSNMIFQVFESVNREFKCRRSLAVPRRPRLAPDARGATLFKAGVCQGELVPCCRLLSLRDRLQLCHSRIHCAGGDSLSACCYWTASTLNVPIHTNSTHTRLGVTSTYTCPVLSIQWLYTMQFFSFNTFICFFFSIQKKKKTAKGSYFVLLVSKAIEMWEETAWERRIAWKHFCLENVPSCNWVNYILPN